MKDQFRYTGYSYRNDERDYEVRRPFGPSVYFGKFTSSEIKFLQKLSHDAKDRSQKLGQQDDESTNSSFPERREGLPGGEALDLRAIHPRN